MGRHWSPMGDIEVYPLRSVIRAGKLVPRWRLGFTKGHPDRWGRNWQAEWTGCAYAPRAYTEHGCWRKARRWQLWHRDKAKAARMKRWRQITGGESNG